MYTLKLRKGGGDRHFISYGRDRHTDRHTDRQTHRSTYRGGAHLKIIQDRPNASCQQSKDWSELKKFVGCSVLY